MSLSAHCMGHVLKVVDGSKEKKALFTLKTFGHHKHLPVFQIRIATNDPRVGKRVNYL